MNVPALTTQREGRKKRKDYASILPGIMSAAGTLLLCRNKDMTAHATITGLQLKSGGATKFTHKRFHARSLSVSYTTTLQKQESLGIGFDEDVRRWKKEMEEDFERRKECQVHVEMLEHKIAEGSHEFSDVLQWEKTERGIPQPRGVKASWFHACWR